jgi:ribosomal protein S18 acetylase RimI-like enzyme
MSDALIRPVVRADREKWQVLWDGYNEFYGRTGAQALESGVSDMTWARFFDSYEPVHALVAERGENLLGLAHFIFHRSTITIEPFCYMQDLFTAKEERGKGVASALIEGVYNRAQQAGAPRVYWQTHESNETAIKLYDKTAEKSGFIVYRRRFISS